MLPTDSAGDPKILPPMDQLAGRKLVIFRYLWGGQVMLHLVPEIVSYLRQSGYQKTIHGYFISAYERPLVFSFASNPLLKSDFKIDYFRHDEEFVRPFIFELSASNNRNSLPEHHTGRGRYVAAQPIEIIADGFSWQQNPNVVTQEQLNVAMPQRMLCVEAIKRALVQKG